MLPLVLFFLILVSSPCVISIAVPSTSRLTNHDASWDLAIREGSRLSQQLESGCYPDTNPLNLGALLAIGFRFGDEWHEEEHIWPPVFKVHSGFESEVVKFLKWTEKGEAYWTVGVFRMCTSLISLFQSYASQSLYKYLSIVTHYHVFLF